MMFFMLLAGSLALADEPLEVDAIVIVPEGATLTVGETTYGIPSKYWLLPDSHYQSAVTQAKKLEICQPALDSCVDTTLAWQDRTYSALQTCSEQFGSDAELVRTLTAQVQTQETRALLAEDNFKRARHHSVVAWGITGGLLAGATVALLVTP